ncbi:nitrate ABC transporter permease [Prauserella marina]|uniref:NitT/TauT family transport system permease protein n=1 Tax=Prauserella marina TaxID=530584 RepID=A0A222VWD9_9PSEU|nr:ABC transporter permease [Prauserella marina]ASR38227.1 nitrate ABC transporter permease [Prauserella marina]PWV78581.1 NitT/TauT family transport system permease protein [Prauserella marina]SDC89280.1 NitT/TauT family transport system permease protein [Prauserella marina]
MRPIFRNLVGLAAFLVIWEAVVRLGLVNEQDLPPASVVLGRTIELLGQEPFLRDVIATLLAWAIAMLVAIAIAVPAGLLLGSLPGLRKATTAIVEFLRPIPSVALIPLAILVVGGGPESKIALAIYASIWPILYNTIYAFAEIDPLLLDTAKSCGAKKGRVLASVALPHAAPFVFTGIRMSSAVALILVVSTEFIAGAATGIGKFILEASSGGGRMDLVLAGTVVAGLLGYLINEGLERLGNRLFRWHTATTTEAA